MPRKQNEALFFGSGRKRMRGFVGEMSPSELPPAVDPGKSVEEAWQWLALNGEVDSHSISSSQAQPND